MLLQMGPLLHLGPIITLVPSTPVKDKQIPTLPAVRVTHHSHHEILRERSQKLRSIGALFQRALFHVVF